MICCACTFWFVEKDCPHPIGWDHQLCERHRTDVREARDRQNRQAILNAERRRLQAAAKLN